MIVQLWNVKPRVCIVSTNSIDKSILQDNMAKHRLDILVLDVCFAHDTMQNLPRHILSYATMPCQIFMLTQT